MHGFITETLTFTAPITSNISSTSIYLAIITSIKLPTRQIGLIRLAAMHECTTMLGEVFL
jgi:hypothetical protein